MPRLIGKQSHAGENIVALIILAAIAGVALEYTDTINVVPGFGDNNRSSLLQSNVKTDRSTAHENR